MFSSSRFTVAVHALVVLAKYAKTAPVCSTFVASSVNTNPVVIRRMMIDLEKAQLVSSSAGRSGGFSLRRPASEISLADIYRAVEDEGIFRSHSPDPKSKCPVGAQILKVLATPFAAAESAMEANLRKTSLDDIALQIAA
jgi:Rrf2 family protein